MVEIYDSHEQSERVKGWLQENGSAIVMGLLLAFGGLFGFKQYQLWEKSKAQMASAEYESMVGLLAEERLDVAVGNFEVLRKDYPGSAYTSMAALHMARARIESGQADLAVGLLGRRDARRRAGTTQGHRAGTPGTPETGPGRTRGGSEAPG